MDSSDVRINKTDARDNNITIYFTVPTLSIDGEHQLTKKEFEDQMSIGGFKQLGRYLIEQLENGLSAMLVDNPVETQTIIKKTNIDK